MIRYTILGLFMLAFLRMSWDGDGSAVLLSSLVGIWAFGVALYEINMGNAPLLFPRRKR